MTPISIRTARPLAVSIAALLLGGSAWAADFTWNSSTGGNWSDGSATGWNTGGAYPSAAGDTATASQNLTGNQTLTIDVIDARLGVLTLQDTVPSNSWFIGGGNALTFDATGAGTAQLNLLGSGTTISAPLVLADDLRIYSDAFFGSTLSGPITGGGKTLRITGGTALTVSGAMTDLGAIALSSGAGVASAGTNAITVNGTINNTAGLALNTEAGSVGQIFVQKAVTLGGALTVDARGFNMVRFGTSGLNVGSVAATNLTLTGSISASPSDRFGSGACLSSSTTAVEVTSSSRSRATSHHSRVHSRMA